MIFTGIYIDNLCSFKDAWLDLTLKRRIKNSTVLYEYLEGREKFLFRRVCILSGANASGKTSFGRLLCEMQNFIAYPGSTYINNLAELVYKKDEVARIRVEFVTAVDYHIHSLEIIINPSPKDSSDFIYATTAIKPSMSNTAARKKLETVLESQAGDKVSAYLATGHEVDEAQWLVEFSSSLRVRDRCGWYYLFSNNQESKDEGKIAKLVVDKRVLQAVLQTFDQSIVAVMESRDADGLNGFNIKFGNRETILLDLGGEPTHPERLSKGTFEAIKLVGFVSRVINDRDPQLPASFTYCLDERMAFAHSELEQATVNLIIEKLSRHAQFFYTTHNYDILDMNLPVHSYVFLRKEGEHARFVQPEESFKKNDRGLLNYVKNDVFRTLPDTSAIDALLLIQTT